MEQKENLNNLEEFLIHLIKDGSNIYGYFISQRKGILPDNTAKYYNIPANIENLPDWFIENNYIALESVKTWQEFFAAIERGEKTGSAHITLKTNVLSKYWLHFNVVNDEKGLPFFAIISFEDITPDYEKFLLEEELRLQAEEIRLTMSQMGKTINYYDIASSTLTLPSSQAKLRGVPNIITDFPETLSHYVPAGFPPTSISIIKDFYKKIRSGKPKGSCKYHYLSEDGTDCWEYLEFVTIFNKEGKPVRTIITVENVTDQTAETKRLKENEHILHIIAQHSDRIICHYDIQKQTAHMWDQDVCSKCQLPRLCEMTSQDILESGDIFPTSIEDVRNMFQDIHNGTPNGTIKMRSKINTGELRWFDLQYSTIYDVEGIPISALISHKDITEQYEHELAYLRIVPQPDHIKETNILSIETDLINDFVEKISGQLLSLEKQQTKCSYSDFLQTMSKLFRFKKYQEAIHYFSRENLLNLYTKNEYRLRNDWQVHLQNGSLSWVNVDVTLLDDPYTGHVKAFLCITDITDEKEALLEIQHRSEQDGMTHLLNRATAEERIRSAIAKNEAPGILILLDLDDLKGINDTFGHKEGDRAILGIAKTLKGHFRDSDIIGRAGGDEFLIYLPGAAKNRDSIAISITALLRKLASTPIGANDERRIHCSVGIAIQTPETDTFEILYKQADKALYHVKRNGKNNFTFYSPDMEQSDYQFQSQKLFFMQNNKKFKSEELQHLLDSISSFYQLVLSVNLSTNDYYLMQEVKNGVFSKVPIFGVLDDFIKLTISQTHPNDISGFTESLSRKALLEAYERGEKSVHYSFRFLNQGEYTWTEATAIFYTNENGDVCNFTLVRWAVERAYELEQLWLKKILELAVFSSFEYICLINVHDGTYFLYGDEKNTHSVPHKGSFDQVTQEIRDQFIAPEHRDSYYEKAKLSSVYAHMQNGNETYIYQYAMPDGIREASFYWFEPTHTQLLMTVHKCHENTL